MTGLDPTDSPKQVDSPNEARAYGTGEMIVIDVVFSQDVVLDGEPTLVLETGIFNQEVIEMTSAQSTGAVNGCVYVLKRLNN